MEVNNVNNATYGSDVSIEYSVNNQTEVSVVIFNKDGTSVDSSHVSFESGSILIKDLAAGEYNITIINKDTSNITGFNTTVDFTVYKANSTLTFSNNVVFVVGKNGTTTITVVGATVEETNIIVNSSDAVVKLEGDVITVSNLTQGKYTLSVTTTPDANHTEVTENVTVTVSESLINPEFVIGINATRADKDVTVNVTAVNTFTGKITVKIAETEVIINLVNGFGSNTTQLAAGDYNAVLNFTANGVFDAYYVNQTFTVDPVPVDPELTVSADNVSVGTPVVIVIKTNTTFTGNVSVQIYDTNMTVEVVNGAGNTTVPIDLPAGTYEVVAIFKETKQFLASEKRINVTVNRINPDLAVSVEPVYVGSNITVVVSTNYEFSGNVVVIINGTEYNATLINGSGKVSVSGYPVGKYNVAAKFAQTDKFAADEVNATAVVKVMPVDPNLTVSVNNIYYGSSAVVVVTTNAAFSGNVNVKVDNADYVVNVVNGAGSISVSALTAGTHSVVATFTATDDFTESIKTTSFKVNNLISLVLKSVKVKKSAKKLTLQATLKINKKAVKGKKITFKFNGKTYKAKTNKKGVAKVTIKKSVLKKLKVGKKVTYSAKYSSKLVKKTVKVKK